MKLGPVNFFYIGIFAWVMTFYFIATGVHDWKLWIVATVALLERLFVQLALFLMARGMKAMARQVMSQVMGGQSGGLGGNSPF